MKTPAWDSWWAQHAASGQWDATMREAALALCPRRGVAVDGGAHVGAWSVPLAAAFDRVIAFEPCAENRACLAANTAHLPNVEIIGQALASERADLHLALARQQGANSGQRVIASAGEPIQAMPLDALDLPALDLLKLDLEGFELPALVGARATIMRHRPTVVIEEACWADLHGLPTRGARTFLLGLGYRVAALFPDNLILTPEAPPCG